MGYLKVVLTGHKSNGGYLTIMKPNMSYDQQKSAEKKLYDGDEIYIPNGPQTLRLDPVGLSKRYDVQRNLLQKKQAYEYSNNVSGRRWDEYYNAAADADNLPSPWETTLDITQNTVVTLTVNSDYNGRILGSPNFAVAVLSSDEIQEISSRIEAKEEENRKWQEERAKKREEEYRIREEDRKNRKKKSLIIWGVVILACVCGIRIFDAQIPLLIGLGVGIWRFIAAIRR